MKYGLFKGSGDIPVKRGDIWRLFLNAECVEIYDEREDAERELSCREAVAVRYKNDKGRERFVVSEVYAVMEADYIGGENDSPDDLTMYVAGEGYDFTPLDPEQTYANRLKKTRQMVGLSQARMAQELGIPRRTIEDWERERSTPPEYVQRLVLERLEQELGK